jgi:ribosomal-protein-alanine N-acetyltransferase
VTEFHGIAIRRALREDAGAIADLHASLFEDGWSSAAMGTFLSDPVSLAFAATSAAGVVGFLLARLVADEAEVLSIGVARPSQRSGVARRLLGALVEPAVADGARSVFLDVASDNAAALALYRGLGWTDTGRRRGYYPRAGAAPADALLLVRNLALDTAPPRVDVP